MAANQETQPQMVSSSSSSLFMPFFDIRVENGKKKIFFFSFLFALRFCIFLIFFFSTQDQHMSSVPEGNVDSPLQGSGPSPLSY